MPETVTRVPGVEPPARCAIVRVPGVEPAAGEPPAGLCACLRHFVPSFPLISPRAAGFYLIFTIAVRARDT